MNKLLVALAAMGMVFAAQGEHKIPRPEVPKSLEAPAGEEVILVGHATGVQIYECKAGANPPWALKAPEADLTDASGKKIIHHFAGPTWQHIDGSAVVGKKVNEDPKPNTIAWLLLTAASHTGQGALSGVTSIQRIHTEGGVPPDAGTCGASSTPKEFRSPYSADYYFYAKER